ncbi:DUF3793 family protein [Aminipila butyrica]|uniref:DUF3793 family protein n=1 Tax=Aminipila butyrica TaxID=433296 RepID=A0A858BUQ8_9FIRM|nr:DUF3793 family protein [Aminipila butyrica]QIB68514.1 DUF3793 family protein [Aminipila butyrica]
MLEKLIIENCAPTLANLKTGEIVNYRFTNSTQAKKEIDRLQEKLKEKGIDIEILQEREKSFLLYVYRRTRLARDLSCPVARELLHKQGYRAGELNEMVGWLRARVNDSTQKGCFPHEIGLFLSYPVQDVKGFMENQGKNCRCCGYWKVYQEEEAAVRMFAKFDKCRAVYRKRCSEGAGIYRLTVAC